MDTIFCAMLIFARPEVTCGNEKTSFLKGMGNFLGAKMIVLSSGLLHPRLVFPWSVMIEYIRVNDERVNRKPGTFINFSPLAAKRREYV